MPELTVPRENRPSLWKYVAYAVLGLLLVNSFASLLVQGSSEAAALIGLFVAGVANLAIFFLLVQSLIQEWIAAAEVVEG